MPFVRPFTMLVPAWLAAEKLLYLLLVVAGCFVIGVIVRTRLGREPRERMEIQPTFDMAT
jgi:hypothetical protein